MGSEFTRHLTGSGEFAADLSFPGELHGYVLRSPHAHAKIEAIDVEAALAVDGVRAIFTGADLEAAGIGPVPCLCPVETADGSQMALPPNNALAIDRVRHVGDGVAFIVAELTTETPFVELRLYKNLPFTMGCFIAFLSTMEFRGTNFLLPIMLQRIYHYTPFQAGLFFLPPALVMGTMSIITGRLADKFQPKILLLIGLLSLAYASLQFCTIDIWTTGGVLLGLIIMRRAAQAFCNTPLTLSTMNNVSDDQVRMASGLFSLHRNLAGAVGVALSATLIESRQDVNTRLFAQQQALYPQGTLEATETIRQVLVQDGQVSDTLNQMINAVLRQKLGEGAALASYHDLFYMFAILALVCIVPVLFLRGGKRRMVGRDAPKPSTDTSRMAKPS